MINDAYWSDHLRRTLQSYDEPLLRAVAAKLFKPRGQWPAEELIERSLASLANAAVIDRRLEDLDLAGRRLLACMGHSRQPRWMLGQLVELLDALGHGEGLLPIFTLFEAGLLYPDLGTSGQGRLARAERQAANGRGVTRLPSLATRHSLRTFEQWLGHASATGFAVFALPMVIHRALGTDLGLPELPSLRLEAGPVHEADGLEWPLRLAVLWQQLGNAPLRRTQGGDFFKRDLDRLRADPILNSAPVDNLSEIPDASLLAIALAQSTGVAELREGEFRAGVLPAEWEGGLPGTLAALWTALPSLQVWNPRDGWSPSPSAGHPYPSAYLLSFLLLAKLPANAWASPTEIERWVVDHHPFWKDEKPRPSRRRSWLSTFLLGFAYQLRLLQAAKGPKGQWLVRLSPLGRWLLGLVEAPIQSTTFTQTLLVQPNLEIVVYRQGLTLGMIARLSRFASWKSLGAACTLQLRADTIYRGLESGLTFEGVLQTLEQHGMRPTPPAVVESLRTWAGKRERITVYPAATLFEFGSGEDLNEALGRGLPGIRLSDRLLVVAGENAIDFRHFRLTGTRDYSLPQEKCVEVDADGVTLAVDLTRSDLLLETELQRFAESLDHAGVNGRRRYRLTPPSLAGGRNSGLLLRDLDDWFTQRAGQPLSPAARLLFGGDQLPPVELRTQLVLHVATSELADGLVQWPGTRSLIRQRLGPTTLVIVEENAELLRQRLGALGLSVQSVVGDL
jgi:hypothetical protein